MPVRVGACTGACALFCVYVSVRVYVCLKRTLPVALQEVMYLESERELLVGIVGREY